MPPSIRPFIPFIHQLLVACSTFSLHLSTRDALVLCHLLETEHARCRLDKMTYVTQTAVLVNKTEYEWVLMKREEGVC